MWLSWAVSPSQHGQLRPVAYEVSILVSILAQAVTTQPITCGSWLQSPSVQMRTVHPLLSKAFRVRQLNHNPQVRSRQCDHTKEGARRAHATSTQQHVGPHRHRAAQSDFGTVRSMPG